MGVRLWRNPRSGKYHLDWGRGRGRKRPCTGTADKAVAEDLRRRKERDLLLEADGLEQLLEDIVTRVLRRELGTLKVLPTPAASATTFPGGDLPQAARRVPAVRAFREHVSLHIANGHSRAHVKNVRSQIRMFLRWAKVKYMDEFRPDHLPNYLKHVRIEERRGDRSIEQKHGILSSWLEDARVRGYIATNLAKLLKPAKPAKLAVRFFGAADVRKILERALSVSPCLAAVNGLAIYAGLRCGEIARLEWEDIDLAGRTIWVRNKPEKATKTKYDREIPLLDQLLGLLHCLPRGQGKVFPWKEDWISKQAVRVCAAAGVTRGGLQVGRHSFATWLAAWGVGSQLAGAWLGHGRQVQEDHYVGRIPRGAEPLEMTLFGDRPGVMGFVTWSDRRTRTVGQ